MLIAPVHIHHPNKLPLQSPTTNCEIHDDSGSLSGDTEPCSDYDNSLTGSEVLKDIHAEFPMLDMPQYEYALTIQGIIYAQSILDFD